MSGWYCQLAVVVLTSIGPSILLPAASNFCASTS